MTIRGKAFIAGAYEHPDRKIPDKSVAQVHAEVALGALADAGLTLADVDGYFCAGDAPGFGPLSMADYLGLTKLRYMDSTETGGSSYVAHVGHAAAAIAAGKCRVALITLAGLPRSQPPPGRGERPGPSTAFESPFGPTTAARCTRWPPGGTCTSTAPPAPSWPRSRSRPRQHAQYNPNAMLRNPVTVEEVLDSPMVSDPLHRLDCCVITDGGGALVVVAPEVARDLARRQRQGARPRRGAQAPGHGRIDLTYTGAVWSGPRAFEEAGVTHADIDYASIYDSFTITVLETIEDLGFCEKGKGGEFVADGALLAPHGALPFNTDGGGLCNNHPANRGGMTKVIEAVRQLRGEANPGCRCRTATSRWCTAPAARSAPGWAARR